MPEEYHVKDGLKYRDLVKLGITAKSEGVKHYVAIDMQTIVFTFDDTQINSLAAVFAIENYLMECWYAAYSRALFVAHGMGRYHVNFRWLGNSKLAIDLRIL